MYDFHLLDQIIAPKNIQNQLQTSKWIQDIQLFHKRSSVSSSKEAKVPMCDDDKFELHDV